MENIPYKDLQTKGINVGMYLHVPVQPKDNIHATEQKQQFWDFFFFLWASFEGPIKWKTSASQGND